MPLSLEDPGRSLVSTARGRGAGGPRSQLRGTPHAWKVWVGYKGLSPEPFILVHSVPGEDSLALAHFRHTTPGPVASPRGKERSQVPLLSHGRLGHGKEGTDLGVGTGTCQVLRCPPGPGWAGLGSAWACSLSVPVEEQSWQRWLQPWTPPRWCHVLLAPWAVCRAVCRASRASQQGLSGPTIPVLRPAPNTQHLPIIS